MVSPGFSSFRDIMDSWDLALVEEALSDKIGALLDSGEYVMYFIRNGDVFGVPEEGRVVFARMKDPEDEDKDWAKDASFIGMNLTQTVKGQPSQGVFAKKDFDKIKIISRDTALERLIKHSKDKDEEIDPNIVIIKGR